MSKQIIEPTTETAGGGGILRHKAEVTKYATFWQVVLNEGTVLAFTDHDKEMELDLDDEHGSIIYKPVGGYNRTNITTSSRLDVDNLEVEGAILESLGINIADIRAGKYDFVQVKIFLADWENPTNDGSIVLPIRLRRGFGGRVSRTDDQYLIEIRGLLERLRPQHGQLFSATCRVDLGSPECGISLTALKEIGNATQVITDKRVFKADGPIRLDPTVDTEADFQAGTFDQLQVGSSGLGAPAVLTMVRQSADENGSDLKPFLVETEADLIAIAGNPSAHYVLVNDIVLTSLWEPIQNFGGTFDGRGHIISNLEIDTAVNRVGLFGTVKEVGRLFRLGVRVGDAGIQTSVGAIIGTLIGNNLGNVKYCYTESPLVPTRGAVFAGTTNTAGGFMGQHGGTAASMTQCWSNVPVTEWELIGESNVGIYCGNKGTGASGSGFVDRDIAAEQSGPPPHSITSDECAQANTHANMLKEATFNGWNGTDVWDFNEDVDYPRLKIATGPLITDHL